MSEHADLRTPVVVGVGNVLLRDEGVGVSVVRRLEDDGPDGLPAGARLVDGGTLGLALLPLVATADPLVLVDAVDLGLDPGAVAVLRGPELEPKASVHAATDQAGIGELLAAARLLGSLPARIVLVAIQPAEIGVGLELTPAVAAAVPVAAALARRELGGA